MQRFLVLLLATSSVFAQSRQPRKVFDSSAREKLSVAPGYVPTTRAAAGQTPADASTTPQAPGVMQIDLADRSRSSWFVSTDTIPKGSTIVAFIVLPALSGSSPQSVQLQAISLTSDLSAGNSLMLPQIAGLGDFWPTGVMTYDVLVKLPDGTNTHAAGDFCTNCARSYDNLLSVSPLIYDSSESLQSDGSVMVTIHGVFNGDPVKVVFEGLAVPQAAISRGDNNSVLVNVSKVPGMALDLYQDFLLAVSQDGWSDTRIFTHVPFQPGTYIPSP